MRAKLRLFQAKHPHALPTLWHGPGQYKAGLWKIFHFCSRRAFDRVMRQLSGR